MTQHYFIRKAYLELNVFNVTCVLLQSVLFFLHVFSASWWHLLCLFKRNQSATASSSIPAVSSPFQRRQVKSAWLALSITRVTNIDTCYWCEPARARTAWAVQQRFVLFDSKVTFHQLNATWCLPLSTVSIMMYFGDIPTVAENLILL